MTYKLTSEPTSQPYVPRRGDAFLLIFGGSVAFGAVESYRPEVDVALTRLQGGGWAHLPAAVIEQGVAVLEQRARGDA